ncbi:hypothetical protein KP509_09G060700 [Ceratopteris richardii]|uniref:ARID domain-containing protein n=1 Tax=Ceratopteris richardii TaxID=49495 RepID=A0A8T2U7U3_CERRI|nr:hypothetical protein KP509_09G060700 [Ceratopteris richardii]KAH7429664.1 hypothetical protein KP509_09G060700 [Ceratopteris richardii]KAH7429665.1 hypothetical protein KP509_09G060700 [Ceratopteris richardii]
MNETGMDISDTAQCEIMVSQAKDDSNLNASSDKCTIQDAIMEHNTVKEVSTVISTTVECQDVGHAADVDINKEVHIKVEEDPRDHGDDQIAGQVNQQVQEGQVMECIEAGDAEKVVDKSNEMDIDTPLANHVQEEQVPEIQEGDLIESIMEVFEARQLLGTRPIPVLVKGKEVNLFQLSHEVRACGGYDQVTLWSSISKTLGFGQEGGPLLKLVYFKYLKSLEDKKLVANQGVQGSLKKKSNGAKVDSSQALLKSPAGLSAKKGSGEDEVKLESSPGDAGIFSSEDSDSFASLLEWVKRLALNPGDRRRGQGVRASKVNEAMTERWEALARKVREALWTKHDHLLHDLVPAESQDEEPWVRKRGRGSHSHGRGSGKRGRRISR